MPSAGRAPGAVPGRVRVVEPLGSHVLVTVTIEGTEFKVARAEATSPPPRTPSCGCARSAEKVRWFDPDTRREVQAEHDPAGSRP